MEKSLIQEFPLKWKNTVKNPGRNFCLIKWLFQELGIPKLALTNSAVGDFRAVALL